MLWTQESESIPTRKRINWSISKLPFSNSDLFGVFWRIYKVYVNKINSTLGIESRRSPSNASMNCVLSGLDDFSWHSNDLCRPSRCVLSLIDMFKPYYKTPSEIRAIIIYAVCWQFSCQNSKWDHYTIHRYVSQVNWNYYRKTLTEFNEIITMCVCPIAHSV